MERDADLLAALARGDRHAVLVGLMERYRQKVMHLALSIVSKTLQKNREERYQAVSELLADLKLLKQQWEFSDQLTHSGHRSTAAATGSNDDAAQPGALSEQGTSEVAATTSKRRADGAQRRKLLVGSVLALIVAGASWLYWRSTKVNQAQAALTRIEEFARAERFFEAYDLAVQAQPYLPSDPTLTRLLRTIADDVTEPASNPIDDIGTIVEQSAGEVVSLITGEAAPDAWGARLQAELEAS
jgi:hypothetical protein